LIRDAASFEFVMAAYKLPAIDARRNKGAASPRFKVPCKARPKFPWKWRAKPRTYLNLLGQLEKIASPVHAFPIYVWGV